MKTKSLNKTGKFIMLSGEIDKNYTVPPGVKITFGEGSTFEGIEVANGTTFCNNESVVKHFSVNQLGKIELTPVSDLPGEDQSIEIEPSKKSLALIIPSSGHHSEFGDDSALELGLSEGFSRQRPLAPTIEKELWKDPLNDNGPPQSSELASPITPILHEELAAPGEQPAQGDQNNGATLSGEIANEGACCDCCLIV